MGKNIIVALSAVFLLFVAALVAASSRLITANWWLFRTWRRQPRKVRTKLALWFGVAVLMPCMFWMRSVALWHYVEVYGIPTFSLVQMLIYMPAFLLSLAAILWWICDLIFNEITAAKSEKLADRVWQGLMVTGAVVGLVTLVANWWL